MAKQIDFNSYAAWDIPVYLNRLNPIPLDKTSIFYDETEAATYAKNETLAYVGQIITVIDENSVDVFKINNDRELEPIAKGYGSITVDTYENVLKAASSENIGQIVYALENTYEYTNEEGEKVYSTEQPEEGVDYVSYSTGAYIVTGSNSVQKLAQSSASGDVSGDIANIQKRLTVVENGITYDGDDIENVEIIENTDENGE